MVWFKVDDKLHDHRKTRQAGVPAMGLWILAGSWCSDNLTDGFIPESVLPRWDNGYRKLAQRLITAGLWSADTVEGEAGYRFHQWVERQPTRAEVENERAEAKQRMADIRAKKKARSEDVRANVQANVQENFGRSSESVRSPRPDPTRPVVPTELQEQPPPSEVAPRNARATRLPEDWDPGPELIRWVQENCAGIDGRIQTMKFRNYWISKSGKDATKMDWDRTYQNWMIESAERIPAKTAGGPSTGTQRAMAAVNAARQITEARNQQTQIGAS